MIVSMTYLQYDCLDDFFAMWYDWSFMTHCLQVADNSWLVQSVDQCPVLAEIVEGKLNNLTTHNKF